MYSRVSRYVDFEDIKIILILPSRIFVAGIVFFGVLNSPIKKTYCL